MRRLFLAFFVLAFVTVSVQAVCSAGFNDTGTGCYKYYPPPGYMFVPATEAGTNSGAPTYSWQLGYFSGASPYTVFHPYDKFGSWSGVYEWYASTIYGDYPNARDNIGATTISAAGTVFPAGQISIHPGANRERSNIRFTALTNVSSCKTYQFSFAFWGLANAYPTTTDVLVTHQGATLYGQNIDTYSNIAPPLQTFCLSMEVGDYVDFSVGDGGNGNSCDTTAVQVVVNNTCNLSCQVLNCGNNCVVCSNATFCASCGNGSTLSNGQCLNPQTQGCAANQYLNGQICTNCIANCASCKSSFCSVCNSNFYLLNGTCVSSCPIGLYRNGIICSVVSPDFMFSWQHGYFLSTGTPVPENFIVYDTFNYFNGYSQWASSVTKNHNYPSSRYNSDESTLVISTLHDPSHQLFLHPGPSGERAALRYYAANSMCITYVLSYSFWSVDTYPATVDVLVQFHGRTLYQQTVNTYHSSAPAQAAKCLRLDFGDFIDVSVGWGANQNYGYDSTGVSVSVVNSCSLCEDLGYGYPANNW